MLNIFFLEKISLLLLIPTYFLYLMNFNRKLSTIYNINLKNSNYFKVIQILTVILLFITLIPYMTLKIIIILTIINIIMILLVNNNQTSSLLLVTNVVFTSFTSLNSFFDILIFLELINIVIIFLILSDKKLFVINKNILLILIVLNVITLTILIFLYMRSTLLYKTTSLTVVSLIINYNLDQTLQLLILLTFFIKVGLLIGPKLNYNVYKFLNKTKLYLYIYIYYFIIPVTLISFISILNINQTILISTIGIVLLTNFSFLKNLKTDRDLIFLSGQINLIYIQLLLI